MGSLRVWRSSAARESRKHLLSDAASPDVRAARLPDFPRAAADSVRDRRNGHVPARARARSALVDRLRLRIVVHVHRNHHVRGVQRARRANHRRDLLAARVLLHPSRDAHRKNRSVRWSCGNAGFLAALLSDPEQLLSPSRRGGVDALLRVAIPGIRVAEDAGENGNGTRCRRVRVCSCGGELPAVPRLCGGISARSGGRRRVRVCHVVLDATGGDLRSRDS